MLVFIDESGDPGFKVARGSSPAFVIALVAFSGRSEALEADGIIRTLAAKRQVKPEFKFSKSHPSVRDAFFTALAPVDFCVRALVVKKALIHSGYLRSNKDAFYKFFVKSMLRFDNGLLQNANVVIDGSGDRSFKKELASYLRRHTEPGAIRKVRFSQSRSDPLVQMADRCTGAIARSYRQERVDANRWLNMLKPKIDDIWDFN